MIEIVGIKFKGGGKLYYFDPNGIKDLHINDNVILETARGLEFGQVAVPNKFVKEEEIVQPLKKVVRIATEEDEIKNQKNLERKKEALNICLEKVREHNLDMKLVDVEYTFDNNKVIFYFTSDGRVDFRNLVKDLAGIFRMRIELRQIGVRDEAKVLGDVGSCGRGLCCAKWLDDFQPVSIKMAKNQNLSLNPAKISGVCGRLMCCLKYENDTYSYLRKGMPMIGDKVKTEDGVGKVISTVLLEELVKVRLYTDEKDEDGNIKLSTDIYEYKKNKVKRLNNRKKEHKESENKCSSCNGGGCCKEQSTKNS